MGRKPCCAKQGLNKGAWSAGEDNILVNYVQIHGEGKWRHLPQKAGLKRCGKSCRLRWLNYLRPDIKRGNISEEEEELIIRLHDLLGNRWSLIAGRLPGRTDNEIKNYWNTNLSRRLKRDDKSMPQYQSEKNGCSRNSSLKLNSSEEIKPQPPRVFRTKAVRCTKVVIPGLLDYNRTVDNIGENSQSSSALRENTNSAGDLLMDYDISELLISDPLSSDGSPFQANEINGSGDHDHNMADGEFYHRSSFKNMSCFPECSDSAYKAIFEDLMDERTIPDNWMDGDPFQNT